MRLQSLSRPPVPYDSSPRLSPYPRELKVTLPLEFTEKVSQFTNFMVQCFLVFKLQPFSYGTNKSKVLFLISHFSGLTFQWA